MSEAGKREEDAEQRTKDTHLMPMGIWDSAGAHGRVWEGSYNLPGEAVVGKGEEGRAMASY